MTDHQPIPRPRTAPRYVSKRTAMALLDLSLSGFSNWVRQGVLPPPCAGTPLHEPRWSWSEIEQWMAGDRSSCRRDLFETDAPIGSKRGPAPGHGGRPRKSHAEQATATDAVKRELVPDLGAAHTPAAAPTSFEP